MKTRHWLVLYCAMTTLDLLMTHWGLATGVFEEVNPIGISMLGIVKVVVYAFVAFLAYLDSEKVQIPLKLGTMVTGVAAIAAMTMMAV